MLECHIWHSMLSVLAAEIRRVLAVRGVTASGVAVAAGLPRRAIQNVLEGHEPRLDRAKQICDALDLELYIGPRRAAESMVREPRDDEYRVSAKRTVESQTVPSTSQLRDLERHAQAISRVLAELRATPAMTAVGKIELHRDADRILIPFASDVRLAAGSGEPVWNETVEMAVSVARSALPSWARPERLRCARVAGDSMAPAIRHGDLVAFDPGQAAPLESHVFGVRTDDGLVVKRLREIRGRWHLISDNPAHKPRAVTDSDRAPGQVAWTGPPSEDAER